MPATMMSQSDYDICYQLVTKLSSKSYANSNYLFLEPVDTAYFPTYNSIITRAMDLGTLQKRLEMGNVYTSREEFFSDVMLTFQNAIQFHSDIKENAWIVRHAKEMVKISNREYKAALQQHQKRKGDSSSATTEKSSKVTNTAVASTSTSSKSNKRKRSITAEENAASAAASSTALLDSGLTTNTDFKKKKTKKLSSPAIDATEPAVVILSSSSKSIKEKEKTGMTKGSVEKDRKSSNSSITSKPKIKLRLSLKKSKSDDASTLDQDTTTTIATTTSTMLKTTSSEASKNKVKSKGSGGGNSVAAGGTTTTNSAYPPSRGKELPKTVASNQQQKQKKKKNNSISPQSSKQQTATVAGSRSTHPPSRGKEIPKSIAATQQQTTAVAKQVISSLATQQQTNMNIPTPLAHTAMTEERKVQCLKFISALKRRQHRNVSWFLKPVSDPRLIDDYIAKIPYPSDLGTVTAKLISEQYATIPDFVRDIRRIFGNCLRYNTSAGDTFRPVACLLAKEVESLLALFLKPYHYTGTTSLYPPLLYCWQVCVGSLDVLLAMKNADDGLPTAHFFLHPASFYFSDKQYPPDYLQKVVEPMDLGTVTSNLMEGVYQSVSKFVADCSLVCQNCYKYNGDRADGAVLVAQAQRLQSQMEQQLGALIRYDQTEGTRLGTSSTQPAIIPKPPPQFLLGILQELRENIYTDRFTKLSERAAEPFEKPVDTSLFPDYLDYVQRPMCLEMIQHNIEMNAYETPEDFEYDVQQIFKNCEDYNLPKKNEHIIAVSKHLSKVFRKLYHSRTKNFEDNAIAGNLGVTPSTYSTISGATDLMATKAKVLTEEKRPSSPTYSIASQVSGAASQVGEKRIKVSSKSSKRSLSRVSSSSNIVNEFSPKVRISTPKLGAVKKGGKKSSQTGDAAAGNAPDFLPRPISLEEAISRIHTQYERRSVKELDSWESACHRLYRELLRHPWLSGVNPKFIYHAPITSIFPEIADAYCAKVEKPMDLSTVESKLLCGSLYACPQDFVNDIALVFSNAISFNKLGRDEGVPTSCAYYDASTHLLRYSRWLSLDVLSNFLFDDSEIGAVPKDGSCCDWKLTTSYKNAAKVELENIALKRHMEKRSDVGDRYTWMEAEAEKLLKSLRHQSDLRYMTYFISPQYPGDYYAFISKPMAWEVVQQNLHSRKYDTLGEVVEDLRLIFSNALRYNSRAKGTDTVSGRAYDAAVYMSIKLESAIQKMLLTVSDRLEREKVEEIIEERDAEAAERSAAMRKREEQIRLQGEWEREQALLVKNNPATSAEKAEKKQQLMETGRVIIKPKLTVKRPTLRFDFEVNEDDIDNASKLEQTHLEAMRLQKALFEKQKYERKMSVNVSKGISTSLFVKLAERATRLESAATISNQHKQQKVIDKDDTLNDSISGTCTNASKVIVSSALQRNVSTLSSREKPIKIALAVFTKKGKSVPRRVIGNLVTFCDD